MVPTWNYAVVHASGPLRVIDDRAWVRRFVEQLTNRHEAPRSDPWKVTDAPADFIDTMTSAIVGIEVPIAQLTGKWKVSQNRPEKDRAGVVEGLMQNRSDDAAAMAQLVQAKERRLKLLAIFRDFGTDAQLLDQFLFPLRHLRAKRCCVELRFLQLGEHFVFFLLDVVLD